MGGIQGAVSGAAGGAIAGSEFGPWGAGIGGAVGGLAGFFGGQETNAANIAMYEDARNTNIAEAQKQRDYLTEMSNTSYQRSVEDMRKAGINPMLAYMKGGASTPGGATASAPSAPRLESSLSKGVSSAVEGLRVANEMKQLNAEVENRKEDTSLKKLQQAVAVNTAEKEAGNAVVAKRNADQADLDLKLRKEGFDAEMRDARISNRRSKVNEKTFIPDTIASKASAYLAPIGSAVGLSRFWKFFKGDSQDGFERKYDRMLERSGAKGVGVP